MKTARLIWVGSLGFVTVAMIIFRVIAFGNENSIQGPVELEGSFQPYASYDKEIKDKLVMKPQPKCGTCHARAVISKADDGKPQLRFSVSHGKVTNSWDLAGTTEVNGLVFSNPKLQLAYTNSVLTGEYSGRVKARIFLKPRQQGQQPVPAGNYGTSSNTPSVMPQK